MARAIVAACKKPSFSASPCHNPQLLNPGQTHLDVWKARVPKERRQATPPWYRLREGPTAYQAGERAVARVRTDLHGNEYRRAHIGGIAGQLLEARDSRA